MIDAGSGLGFHRGGFAGICFNSLSFVDISRLTRWAPFEDPELKGVVRLTRAVVQAAVHVAAFAITSHHVGSHTAFLEFGPIESLHSQVVTGGPFGHVLMLPGRVA